MHHQRPLAMPSTLSADWAFPTSGLIACASCKTRMISPTGVSLYWTVDDATQRADAIFSRKNEAPKMCDVYNNATVTLSAAASLGTTGGLYPKPEVRKPRQEVVEISAPAPDGKSSTVIYARGRAVD